MARIRTVKPDLFEHEQLFDAEKEFGLPLRLAYIGLWTQCDREGRFLWRPRQLKLNILPWDDCDFERVLDALWTRGFLVKYASDGNTYGCIPTWHKHQFINNKEKESDLPEVSSETIVSIEKPNASATREARVNDASFPSPSLPIIRSLPKRAHALPKNWTPTENHFSYGESRGFDRARVEDIAEAMRFWAWGKGELRKDWDMTFSGFLRREQGRGQGPPRREQQFTDAVQQHMAKVQARSNGNGRRDVRSEGGKHDLRLVYKSDSEHTPDARTIDHAPSGEAQGSCGPNVRSEGGGGG